MLALHTRAQIDASLSGRILKVLSIDEALEYKVPMERVLVDLRKPPIVASGALRSLGVAGALSNTPIDGLPAIWELGNQAVISDGDVVRVRENGQASVLYRRGANANFLFATERCNSLCLMCSQPPREIDDSWRVREILDTVQLVDENIESLGLTGGETTLLGADLAKIIAAVKQSAPRAQFNVLTNARLLSDHALANQLTGNSKHVLWAVPLYGDTAAQHDYVVQASGAFEQTLEGIYNLAERNQSIEIRCVLTRATIDRLVPLAEFIWRNMPFVAHVALMGLEPMGFAKVNRELLFMDPMDYREVLEEAAWYLHDRGIPTSIYNTPLCLLSKRARALAKRSISDWKNMYPAECDPCALKEKCAGFFMSAGPEWRSKGIKPVLEGE